MSAWRTLDRILSFYSCFEEEGNDRLIMLCLFAMGQVLMVDVGLGSCGGRGPEP